MQATRSQSHFGKSSRGRESQIIFDYKINLVILPVRVSVNVTNYAIRCPLLRLLRGYYTKKVGLVGSVIAH